MKLYKISSLIPLALGSLLPISANEYKFENIKFEQLANQKVTYEPKDTYEPKGKLDEFIINASIYASKFVPLTNNDAYENEYSNIISNDGKRLLVDAGYGFVNANANSQIQKIPFFAQTTVNISGGTESDTSFSLNSLMKLG